MRILGSPAHRSQRTYLLWTTMSALTRDFVDGVERGFRAAKQPRTRIIFQQRKQHIERAFQRRSQLGHQRAHPAARARQAGQIGLVDALQNGVPHLSRQVLGRWGCHLLLRRPVWGVETQQRAQACPGFFVLEPDDLQGRHPPPAALNEEPADLNEEPGDRTHFGPQNVKTATNLTNLDTPDY